jgi:transposase
MQVRLARLPIGLKQRLKQVRVWGCIANIEAVRLKGGEYLIVVSDQLKGALNRYKKRWRIETLFGHLKSRGFRFRKTHLKDPSRISKLLALLALAFCYALQMGVWRITQGKHIVFKSSLKRPLKSVFRHGFDYLRMLLLNIREKWLEFLRLPKFLSCT